MIFILSGLVVSCPFELVRSGLKVIKFLMISSPMQVLLLGDFCWRNNQPSVWRLPRPMLLQLVLWGLVIYDLEPNSVRTVPSWHCRCSEAPSVCLNYTLQFVNNNLPRLLLTSKLRGKTQLSDRQSCKKTATNLSSHSWFIFVENHPIGSCWLSWLSRAPSSWRLSHGFFVFQLSLPRDESSKWPGRLNGTGTWKNHAWKFQNFTTFFQTISKLLINTTFFHQQPFETMKQKPLC